MSQASYTTVSDDLDRMARLSCALEAYGEILRRGEVNPESSLGQSLALGLEAIDPNIDIREGSVVTLRAIKEGIVQLAKMTRNAVRMLLELIQSFYVKFTGSLGAVRSRQKKIGKMLGKLGGKVAYTTMEVSGIHRLCINGQFVGDDVNSLNDMRLVTDFILNAYPKAVAAVSRDASRQFLNIAERSEERASKEIAREAISSFAKVMQTRLQVPPMFVSASSKELPPAFNGSGAYHRSPFMPGNMALVFTHPSEIVARAEKTQVGNYAGLISSAFTCKFLELPLNAVDRGTREVEVPSIKTLNGLYQGISNILDLAERGESGVRDFQTVKAIVDDAIRQVAEMNDNAGNASNVMIHMLGAMSEKLAEPMGSFTHWLAITLNVYLAYMEHCIRHYQSEGV